MTWHAELVLAPQLRCPTLPNAPSGAAMTLTCLGSSQPGTLAPHWHGALLAPHWHDTLLAPHWHGALLAPLWHGALLAPHCQGALLAPHWQGALYIRFRY